MLARRGYLVFAYDHTGCMESEGASTNGFAQSLSDLDDAVRAIKSSDAYGGRSIAVVGHSWGGFATLNIPALHPDITHIVPMAGFLSVEAILSQNFSGLKKGYYPAVYRMEAEANPEFVKYNAIDTFKSMKTRALVIHSADDKIVRALDHFAVLRRAMQGYEDRVSFLLVNFKGHNPNFTEDAAAYKDVFFADLMKRTKKKALENESARRALVERYDWSRMTAQDGEVWDRIFAFLES